MINKCRVSLNAYNHNIYASNNAFINHYHLFFKEKIFVVHNQPEQSITHACEKYFVHNQPESSITHAYVSKSSTTHAYESET